MTLKDVERVLYFENYIVTEPGLTPFMSMAAADRREYITAQEEYRRRCFTAGIGAEAMREMLMGIDLEKLRDDLRRRSPSPLPNSSRRSSPSA
jgi:DNA-directed RNA polymerase subunit beta'